MVPALRFATLLWLLSSHCVLALRHPRELGVDSRLQIRNPFICHGDGTFCDHDVVLQTCSGGEITPSNTTSCNSDACRGQCVENTSGNAQCVCVDTPFELTSSSDQSAPTSTTSPTTLTSTSASALQTTTTQKSVATTVSGSPTATGTQAAGASAAAAIPSFGASSSSSDSDTGLATPKIIGIVVGVVGGLALVLTILATCRRKRSPGQMPELPPPINLADVNTGTTAAAAAAAEVHVNVFTDKASTVSQDSHSPYSHGTARWLDSGRREHTPPYHV